jgi:hypothetical protein
MTWQQRIEQRTQSDGGLTNQRNRATSAGGGTDAHNETRKEYQMETEAMYGGRDVAYMTPRIFDRTSCRMPGSIRQSLLAGAIRYGIATPSSILPVRYIEEDLRRLKTRFLEKAYGNCITQIKGGL